MCDDTGVRPQANGDYSYAEMVFYCTVTTRNLDGNR